MPKQASKIPPNFQEYNKPDQSARERDKSGLTQLQNGILTVLQKRKHQGEKITNSIIADELMQMGIYKKVKGEEYL